MSGVEVDNSRVLEIKPLISPELLREEIPGDTDPKVYATVLQGRASCEQVISGVDDRLLVIVGPCSIHDPKAALEYGTDSPVVCLTFFQHICCFLALRSIPRIC
jgi:3-deoxy-7-phosphoheptulonate synthase